MASLVIGATVPEEDEGEKKEGEKRKKKKQPKKTEAEEGDYVSCKRGIAFGYRVVQITIALVRFVREHTRLCTRMKWN